MAIASRELPVLWGEAVCCHGSVSQGLGRRWHFEAGRPHRSSAVWCNAPRPIRGDRTDRACVAGLEGNLPDNVDTDHMLTIRQECKKTGTLTLAGEHTIAFDYDNKFNTCKNPLSPSIDRIDSTKGYSNDNVHIVLWQYNLMRGELTDDQLFDIFGEYFKSKVLDDYD